MALWDKLDKFLPSQEKEEKKAREHWDNAVKYFEGKLYTRALKEMNTALALNPDLSRDALDMMNSFSVGDNDEVALSVGMALLKLEPQNTELINKLGNSLRKTNSFAKAQKLYRYALKVEPKLQEARYNLAACSFRIITSDGALISQTKKVEVLKEWRRYDFMGAREGFYPLPNEELDEDLIKEMEARKKEEAEAASEGEEELSDEARAHMLEGYVRELKTDIESSDSSMESLYNLGLLYDLNNLTELCLTNYQMALEKDPDNRKIINNIAVARIVHEDNLDAAESMLLKNLERHRFDRTTVLNLALLYRKMGKGFQTLKYFVYLGDLLEKSLMNFETDKAEAHAQVLFEKRKYLDAVPIFENLGREKQQVFWYEKLAVMYLNLKKEDNLIASFKQIIRLDPENEEARSKITEYAANYEEQAHEKMEKGNMRQAIELLLKSVQIEETPERWVELAQLYTDEGEEILADNALRRWKKLVGHPEEEGAEKGAAQ